MQTLKSRAVPKLESVAGALRHKVQFLSGSKRKAFTVGLRQCERGCDGPVEVRLNARAMCCNHRPTVNALSCKAHHAASNPVWRINANQVPSRADSEPYKFEIRLNYWSGKRRASAVLRMEC